MAQPKVKTKVGNRLSEIQYWTRIHSAMAVYCRQMPAVMVQAATIIGNCYGNDCEEAYIKKKIDS